MLLARCLLFQQLTRIAIGFWWPRMPMSSSHSTRSVLITVVVFQLRVRHSNCPTDPCLHVYNESSLLLPSLETSRNLAFGTPSVEKKSSGTILAATTAMLKSLSRATKRRVHFD